MTKILRVGDPHVQINNLKESEQLLDFITKIAIENNVDAVEFLGDLFHNHAVVRLEVVDFWKRKLQDLATATSKNDTQVIVIAGNHDFCGDKATEGKYSAISCLGNIHNVTIVNNIYVHKYNDVSIGYRAYTSDKDAFLKSCEKLVNFGASAIVCHQTFEGVAFWADEAIDSTSVSVPLISGHIHSSMTVGNCFYPGTPRWLTKDDANKDKGIWLYEYSEKPVSKQFISTKDVVPVIREIRIKEGDELILPEGCDNLYVELEGKSAWIADIKKTLAKNSGVKIKAIPTDSKNIDKNIEISNIYNYLDTGFSLIPQVSKEDVKRYLEAV